VNKYIYETNILVCFKVSIKPEKYYLQFALAYSNRCYLNPYELYTYKKSTASSESSIPLTPSPKKKRKLRPRVRVYGSALVLGFLGLLVGVIFIVDFRNPGEPRLTFNTF